MIRDEADINCSALTELFRSKGLMEDTNRIIAMDKVFHHCEGSFSFTVSLEYLKERQKSPPSIFVKLDKVRGGEHYKRLTRNEIEFYNLSQNHDMNLFLPHYMDGWYNDVFSYLILEDLSEEYISSEYSSDLDYFYIAVERIAAFHASCRNLNISKSSCNPYAPFESSVDLNLISNNHEKMLSLLGDRLDKRTKDLLADALLFLQSNRAEINQGVNSKKSTIIHGDFHLKNCLFNKQNSQENLKIIDWQWWNFGIGTYDIAHLLNLYLPKEWKDKEFDILKTYYNKLVEHGFTEYAWSECLNDYMIFTTLNLFKPALYAISCELRRRKDFWISFIDNIVTSFLATRVNSS